MRSLAVVFTLLALLAAGATYDPLKAEDNVVICHVPPGNPAAEQTITVGAKAAEAHLAKHPLDTAGDCESSFCEQEAISTCTEPRDCFVETCEPDGRLVVECDEGDCDDYAGCLEANGVEVGGLECTEGGSTS